MIKLEHKIFYFRKRVLQFKKPNDCLTDNDFINLFQGFLKLIKHNAEKNMEFKYQNKILSLENQIQLLKSNMK